MTLVDKHLLNAALAERDAAREENARLRAAVETYLAHAYPNGRHVVSTADLRAALVPVCMPRNPRSEVWEPAALTGHENFEVLPDEVHAALMTPDDRAALAVPTADDGAERGAR